MKYDLAAVEIETFEVSKNPTTLRELLDGQKAVLDFFGVQHSILFECDECPPPGTFAVVARARDGRVVGGTRVHTRQGRRDLPVESATSPLAHEYRTLLRREPRLSEARGLWVARDFAKGQVSNRIVATASRLAFRHGARALVALMHTKSYAGAVIPLGSEYSVDSRIPSIPYPDPRFRSFLVWHRAPEVWGQLEIAE